MATGTNLTLKQRRKMQGIAMPEKRAAAPSEVSKKVSYTIFALAFGIGILVALLYFKADARAVELANEEALLAEAGSDMPSDVAQDLGERVRDLRDQLPGRRSDFLSSYVNHFFAMSSADQLADLKRRVEREKAREQYRAQQDQQNQANGNASQSNNSNNNNDNNGKGGSGRGHMSDTQRAERMEQRLAKLPPQQRAQFGLMKQMGTAVRQQMSH